MAKLSNPGELLHELVEKAAMDPYLYSDKASKPGYFIERLNSEDREIIRKLTGAMTYPKDTIIRRVCWKKAFPSLDEYYRALKTRNS